MDEIPPSESVLFWEGDTGGIDNLQNDSTPLIAESASDDLGMIKAIVSITLGMTLLLATGYLVAVILSDGAILLRPSEVALERHVEYNDLIHHSESLDGSGHKAPDQALEPTSLLRRSSVLSSTARLCSFRGDQTTKATRVLLGVEIAF